MHFRNYLLSLLIIAFTQLVAAQEFWQPLFMNGDLSDFRQLNGTAEYVFEDGVLTGLTKRGTPNSFLATNQAYSDFILEFEVKIENGMNSGVQIRSATAEESGHVFGYQVEIETSVRKWAGGIYDEGRRGWLYGLQRNEKGQNAFRNGEWNHYRIEAIGSSMKTWVNGVACARLVDDLTAAGFIAFQVHSIGDQDPEGQKVQWRNVRILTENAEAAQLPIADIEEISFLTNQLTETEKRKGWRLLWDGQTTTGWHSANGDGFPTQGWRIEGDDLMVEQSNGEESQNGGDIITTAQFSNFELSIDFQIRAGANSGVKYFVQPETDRIGHSAIGLEFQILDDASHPDGQEGLDGNRTAGALYDLIPPFNLSDAHTTTKHYSVGSFNRARILVRDGQVEHWLNGSKIVEYDRFSQVFKTLVAHSKYRDIENFGQQTSGHILLQDHGDQVAFRNIKIREW